MRSDSRRRGAASAAATANSRQNGRRAAGRPSVGRRQRPRLFTSSKKTAAKMGYKTTIVSARKSSSRNLLWSEAREEPRDPNLTVLGVTETRTPRPSTTPSRTLMD